MNLQILNRVCEHLEKYVFDKVWNEPYSEYRTFTVPQLLSTVPVSGLFFGRYNRVVLPSATELLDYIGTDTRGNYLTPSFYVYSVPANQFRTLVLDVPDWITLESFCTDHLIDLEFFSKSGRRVWRKAIYIKQSERNDCILIAVESHLFAKTIGYVDPEGSSVPSDMFFGKYFDSDLVTSVKYNCFSLTKESISVEDSDPITTGGKYSPTYTLLNGRLLTGTYYTEDESGKKHYDTYLYQGDLVENVFDENIIGTVDVPITDNNAPIYLGSDGGSRLLVHIPKTLNKTRVVITPNTCDMYVVPTEMESETSVSQRSGIYLYQCGRGDSFHQITHNDFGIDLEWLTNVAKDAGFKKYFLRMFVRIHNHNHQAIRDANYINVLYHQDDTTITNFLLGKGDPKMYFWKADYLEGGLYAGALIRRRGTKPSASEQCELCKVADLCTEKPIEVQSCPTYSHRSLNDYIDILGYYHTLALIGKRVTHFRVTGVLQSGYPNEFVVRAPLALCDSDPTEFYPVVYLNGKRLTQDHVSILTGSNLGNAFCEELFFSEEIKWWTNVIADLYAPKLRVILDSSVTLCVGDIVVVELFEKRKDAAEPILYEYKSSYGALVIPMKSVDDWEVYQVRGSDGQMLYEKLDDPGEFDETSKELVVDEHYKGSMLLAVEKSNTLENHEQFDVTYTKTGYLGSSICSEAYDGTVFLKNFPLVSPLAFLNGRRLIDGLDYATDGYQNEDDINGMKFYLQNVSYLTKKENKLDVLRTSQTTLSSQRGFLKGNIVEWDHSNLFWFDELSILTIGGQVCSHFIHDMGTITISDEHQNGIPFEIHTSVARRVKEFLGDYHEAMDVEKIGLIKYYFDSIAQKNDYRTFVPKAYKVYSLFTEMIITAYVNTEFDFILYPDKYNFEKQFDPFLKWKERDVVYKLSEDDLRYVDIYPFYNRLQLPNHSNYHKISQMVKRLLPTDNIKHKDAHNDQ